MFPYLQATYKKYDPELKIPLFYSLHKSKKANLYDATICYVYSAFLNLYTGTSCAIPERGPINCLCKL